MRNINNLPQDLLDRAKRVGVFLFERDADPSPFSIEPPLIPGQKRIYVVDRIDASLIGYLDYLWEDDSVNRGHTQHIITQLYVRMESQGKGIGGLLLDCALHQFKIFQIQVGINNKPSLGQSFKSNLEDVAEHLQPDIGKTYPKIRLFDFYKSRGYRTTHEYSDGAREMELVLGALSSKGKVTSAMSKDLVKNLHRRHSFGGIEYEKPWLPKVKLPMANDELPIIELSEVIADLPRLVVKESDLDDLASLKSELQQWLLDNGLDYDGVEFSPSN
jgi:hypothetical protein